VRGHGDVLGGAACEVLPRRRVESFPRPRLELDHIRGEVAHPAGTLSFRDMPDISFIAVDVRTVDATVDAGRVLVEPSRLPAALGWDLKPEGLCRDDVCVPVRDPSALYVDDQLDVERVAAALDRPIVVDAGARVVSIALPAE